MLKKITALLLTLVLVLSLAACGTDEPLPATDTDLPAATVADTAMQEEILLMLGATWFDFDGRVTMQPYPLSLYYTCYDGGFSDGAALSGSDYYTWYVTSCYRVDGLTSGERGEKYATPAEFGEYTGYAYPAEYFEPAVTQYFGVTAEQLRQTELYRPEYDCYWEQRMGGRGDTPELEIYSAEQQEDLLTLHLSLVLNRYYQQDEDANNAFMALTVRLLPEGGWQYVSYLPDKAVTEEQKNSLYRNLCDTPNDSTVPYVNTEYGFSLELPEEWAGLYTAQETEMYYGPEDDHVLGIELRYQGSPYPLCWVYAVPLEQTAEFEANMSKSACFIVWAGENSAYRFAVMDAIGWENPFRTSSEDYSRYHTMQLCNENFAERLTATEPQG